MEEMTMCEENIGVLRAGERFSYKGFDWICLDHVDDGVLAIMANSWNGEEYPFNEDGHNDYRTSSLRRKLLNDLLPVLGEDNLLPRVVDLVADNGDTRYGTVTDKVFILSCDEYRKYRKYVPLLPEWMWTCTPWYISEVGRSDYVRSVFITGVLDSYNVANSRIGVAPACVFSSKNLKLRRQAQMVEAE
jgi:hypothetical protein